MGLQVDTLCNKMVLLSKKIGISAKIACALMSKKNMPQCYWGESIYIAATL